jgi:hypothetical protein
VVPLTKFLETSGIAGCSALLSRSPTTRTIRNRSESANIARVTPNPDRSNTAPCTLGVSTPTSSYSRSRSTRQRSHGTCLPNQLSWISPIRTAFKTACARSWASSLP